MKDREGVSSRAYMDEGMSLLAQCSFPVLVVANSALLSPKAGGAGSRRQDWSPEHSFRDRNTNQEHSFFATLLEHSRPLDVGVLIRLLCSTVSSPRASNLSHVQRDLAFRIVWDGNREKRSEALTLTGWDVELSRCNVGGFMISYVRGATAAGRSCPRRHR